MKQTHYFNDLSKDVGQTIIVIGLEGIMYKQDEKGNKIRQYGKNQVRIKIWIKALNNTIIKCNGAFNPSLREVIILEKGKQKSSNNTPYHWYQHSC